MRRLRTLVPFAGCRSRVAGVNARPGPVSPASGRVDRRRLLGLLGAAPVAMPALARAAMAPEPFSSTIYFDADGSYAASLARYHDELEAWAADVQTWCDRTVPPAPVPPVAPGTAVPRLGRRRPLPAARPIPFTDDVGSGP